MKNTNVKNADSKAKFTFIIILILSCLFGGFLGFFSAGLDIKNIMSYVENATSFFGMYIAPFLFIALSVVTLSICITLFKKAKKQISSWDGEDEAVSDSFEQKLSTVIIITSISMIVSFLLTAAVYSNSELIFDSLFATILFLVTIIVMIVNEAVCFIFQKKCVDAVKKTNPEKQGSVYDFKFNKKWLDSCDEAEKIMIGKCAYKAYAATNVLCTVLATFLTLAALLLGTGFFATFVVCLIWIVNLLTYYKEGKKISKGFIS